MAETDKEMDVTTVQVVLGMPLNLLDRGLCLIEGHGGGVR